ncbi:MAG: dienelactone hydrolase family protein [Ilumatobacteraceae bacterium]|jgi:carboxymethylenebutenolidase
MIELELDIAAPDGAMKTFVFHPEHGGPHPVVLYLMDAPSIRPALKDMASRLATTGYYVMLPYLFYRGGPFREFGQSDEDMHRRRELMDQVTPTNIVGDARALLDHAASDAAAAPGNVGVVGFCMSGGLAVSVARAMPERVSAAASIHGAWLVRDSPDSPHLDLDRVRAEIYFGWCDNDATAPPETVPVMRAALDAAGVEYTLDFLTDAVHGYAPPGTERYDRYASELHWERVHDLFRRRVPVS